MATCGELIAMLAGRLSLILLLFPFLLKSEAGSLGIEVRFLPL